MCCTSFFVESCKDSFVKGVDGQVLIFHYYLLFSVQDYTTEINANSNGTMYREGFSCQIG
jgi:hypothetical protein